MRLLRRDSVRGLQRPRQCPHWTSPGILRLAVRWLQPSRAVGGRELSTNGIGGIDQYGKPCGFWQKLLQEPKPLWHKLDAHRGDTSDIAARPVEAGDKTGADRVSTDAEDDRNRRGCGLCSGRGQR